MEFRQDVIPKVLIKKNLQKDNGRLTDLSILSLTKVWVTGIGMPLIRMILMKRILIGLEYIRKSKGTLHRRSLISIL